MGEIKHFRCTGALWKNTKLGWDIMTPVPWSQYVVGFRSPVNIIMLYGRMNSRNAEKLWNYAWTVETGIVILSQWLNSWSLLSHNIQKFWLAHFFSWLRVKWLAPLFHTSWTDGFESHLLCSLCVELACHTSAVWRNIDGFIFIPEKEAHIIRSWL